MAQLINKDILIAEIKKLKGKVDDESSYCNGWQQALRMLEIVLDTIEVKYSELTWEDVALIVNEVILKCKVESTLTAEDICKDVLSQFKAKTINENRT